MAKKEEVKNPFMDMLGSFDAQNAPGLDAFTKMGEAMVDYFGQSGSEFVEFVSKRLAADVQVQKELLNCRNPSDLAGIQTDYLRTAMEQYTSETGKVVEMNSAALENLFKSVAK